MGQQAGDMGCARGCPGLLPWAGKRLPHEWEWHTRRRGWMAASIRGETIGTLQPFRCPTKGRDLRAPDDVTRTRRSESVWRYGLGWERLAVDRRIHKTNIRAERFFAEEVIINPKDRCGISHRHTKLMSTANSCSWHPARIAPEPWDFAVLVKRNEWAEIDGCPSSWNG